ncbi:DUF2306 domain-containing protein [Granulicella sp. dw_53]|uniref:DUF2306 domain-containing protein n=1 Tax=Granulicella sp. dw_53 TaxID=2719792 RepID=UPI001BD1E173|nr:DUF2306 domain-containing protein [Granulicella sp. dw_53]
MIDGALTSEKAVSSLSISTSRRKKLKMAVWIAIGAMTLSVIFYSEVPLLNQAKERAYLRTILLLIIPHVTAGILALLSGPLQFSRRLRRRSPRFHRVLGRVYVFSVFVSAPLGIVMSNHRHDPRAIHFVAATAVQSGTWMITTAAAFLTARNGYFRQHREWMIRSYAVTLTFVATRVLQPIPAWNRHSEAGFAMEIIVITFMAVLLPDIALHWHELTSSRS